MKLHFMEDPAAHADLALKEAGQIISYILKAIYLIDNGLDVLSACYDGWFQT